MLKPILYQRGSAVVFALVACLFSACAKQETSSSHPAPAASPLGSYCFNWPSGEAEVIRLSGGMTYQHVLYSRSAEPREVIDESSGKWSIKQGGPGMGDIIKFEPFRSYYEITQLQRPILRDMSFREITMRWDSYGPKIRYDMESQYIFDFSENQTADSTSDN